MELLNLIDAAPEQVRGHSFEEVAHDPEEAPVDSGQLQTNSAASEIGLGQLHPSELPSGERIGAGCSAAEGLLQSPLSSLECSPRVEAVHIPWLMATQLLFKLCEEPGAVNPLPLRYLGKLYVLRLGHDGANVCWYVEGDSWNLCVLLKL